MAISISPIIGLRSTICGKVLLGRNRICFTLFTTADSSFDGPAVVIISESRSSLYEHQSQGTDEGPDILPPLGWEECQNALFLSLLLSGHGAISPWVIWTDRSDALLLRPVRRARPLWQPGPDVPARAAVPRPSLTGTHCNRPSRPCPSPAGWIRGAG